MYKLRRIHGAFIAGFSCLCLSHAASEESAKAPLQPAKLSPDSAVSMPSQPGKVPMGGGPAVISEPEGFGVTSAFNGSASLGSDNTPAPYLLEGQRLAPEVVDGWLSDPNAVLSRNPNGGVVLADFVRLLVGTDNRTVAVIISTSKLPDVSFGQIDAFGRGLAYATKDAQVAAPLYSSYIQMSVARSESPDLIAAFAKWLADPETSELSEAAGAPGSPGAGVGSLTGIGGIGPSGSVGGVSTVETTSQGSTFGRGSVSDGGGGGVTVSDISPI